MKTIDNSIYYITAKSKHKKKKKKKLSIDEQFKLIDINKLYKELESIF